LNWTEVETSTVSLSVYIREEVKNLKGRKSSDQAACSMCERGWQ